MLFNRQIKLNNSAHASPQGSLHGKKLLDLSRSSHKLEKPHYGYRSINVSTSELLKSKLDTQPFSCTHKDYLKNMLYKKFTKKYGETRVIDFRISSLINNEILNFLKTEKISKDNLKQLE